MILACDQYEEIIRLAWGDELGEVRLEEYEGQEAAIHRIQELGENAERIVIAQDSPLVRALAQSEEVVSRIPRLEAVYWGVREQVNGDGCLILSLGQKCCVGGVVKEGRFLREQVGSPDLGLHAIYGEWIEKVQTLKRGIESFFGGESLPEADEAGFRELLRALRGRKVQLPLLASPLNLAQAAGPHLKSWKRQMQEFLAQLDPRREIRTLVCTDWAATGSLAELFQDEYQIVSSRIDPLADAVRGMVLFGREGGTIRRQPAVELREEPEEREAGAEVPNRQVQEVERIAKQLLAEGRHDEAISRLDFLCQAEPENEVFRLWRLLARRLQEAGERSAEEDRFVWQDTTRAVLGEELKSKEARIVALEKQVRGRKRLTVLLSISVVAGFVMWLAQFAGKQAAITTLQNELEKKGQQIAGLQNELDRKNQQIASFANKNTAAGSEIDKQIIALREVIKQKDGQIQSLEERLKDALARNTDGGEQSPDSRIATLEQDVKEKEARIAALGRELNEKTQRIAASEQDREEKARKIAALQQEPDGGRGLSSPTGQYRMVRRTPLLRAPRGNADVVTWLNRDQRVRVVRVEGKWLRVESSHADKPPGYLRREDAEPE